MQNELARGLGLNLLSVLLVNFEITENPMFLVRFFGPRRPHGPRLKYRAEATVVHASARATKVRSLQSGLCAHCSGPLKCEVRAREFFASGFSSCKQNSVSYQRMVIHQENTVIFVI